MADVNYSIDATEAAEAMSFFNELIGQVDEALEYSHLMTRDELLELLRTEHDLFKSIVMASGMVLEMNIITQLPETLNE